MAGQAALGQADRDAQARPRSPGCSKRSDDVLTEALKAGGTSSDALYVNVNGESGYFDRVAATPTAARASRAAGAAPRSAGTRS